MTVRELKYAGHFYPNDLAVLEQQIHYFLQGDISTKLNNKAIIVPHAGFSYSGKIAGKAYQHVQNKTAKIKRVVVLAPSHTKAITESAIASFSHFKTPWGQQPLDREWLEGFVCDDKAHEQEYSIEVQLPFIAKLFPSATLVPVLVGEKVCSSLLGLVERAWSAPNTLIVVSSDLYHYVKPQQAIYLGRAISYKIESLDTQITASDACGHIAIQSLLSVLNKYAAKIQTLALQHSGQTTYASQDQVVGYGAFVVSH